MISTKDVLKSCRIFEQNEHHFFLSNDDKMRYYDIVMPKDEIPRDLMNVHKIGSIIDVCVLGINIADDGTPGVFVKPHLSNNQETIKEENLCVVCGIDMGECNPRQYCGKTRCLNE